MPQSEQLYNVALSLVPNVGCVTAKNLISYCGSAEKVFNVSKKKLLTIPGVGGAMAESILHFKEFSRAEKELEFAEKNNIRILDFNADDYPKRLRNCIDAPMVLYYMGNAELNATKVIGIVGTRNATAYGKHFCDTLIKELQSYGVMIVSGMAYGIDIAAHKACIKYDVPTVGVFAHGLDRIYPAIHKDAARKMIDNGGLLTEFITGTNPDRENFPMRNRIVAGMIDGLIVVETDREGGSMITASIAYNYNRDVMAVPGNIDNKNSKGCNYLIKKNRAALIENAADVVELMNWEINEQKHKTQRELFIELDAEEKIVYDVLIQHGEMHVDELSQCLPFSPGKLAGLLLNLEFQNVIISLAGKRYKTA
ncbi:MAG: DNA-processing protein DprA [Chitinophagales bacterium]|nr:DNA-protecting protein DprA [Bacteroidota bacterium]MBK8487190.1 DNA-protecting protein DprA [Bacteroidota bacterium]MBK8680576.1 DNA-protecting protein DprA [Bacteroidota bacterium]